MITVFYPRGSGGNWLSNLIWHLENQNWELPNVNVVFDNEPKSTIAFKHAFEIHDPQRPDQISYSTRTSKTLLFSCAELFIHYLNHAIKAKYHFHNLGRLSFKEQLFELSNNAHFFMSNAVYQDYYCKNIDLNYRLIFQDPEQFANQLFDMLNNLNIQYTANYNYVYDSIAYYRTTCPDPIDHYNNTQSILWLGYCHAITLIDQLPLAEIIGNDLDSTVELLAPYTEHCKQRVRNQMFEWKNEYTTR